MLASQPHVRRFLRATLSIDLDTTYSRQPNRLITKRHRVSVLCARNQHISPACHEPAESCYRRSFSFIEIQGGLLEG